MELLSTGKLLDAPMVSFFTFRWYRINDPVQTHSFWVWQTASAERTVWPEVLMDLVQPLSILFEKTDQLAARAPWFSFVFRVLQVVVSEKPLRQPYPSRQIAIIELVT